MADIFDYAQCQEVFYKKGHFTYAEATPRFIRAPFRLLLMPGNTTVAPDLFVEPTPAAGIPDALWGADSFREDEYLGREGLAYLKQPAVVLEEHEMGNWTANGETWRGVHAFGML